jgi:hypothetical protein
VINAFEHDAPVEGFLDKHRVQLLHDGHGPGERVMKIGATSTVRVVKPDSKSFRVIRFRDGRPATYTYRGHATAAIPFSRTSEAPVRARMELLKDGAAARWTNDLEEDVPGARFIFVLPRGKYVAERGRIESAIDSDDGKLSVIAVRADPPGRSRGAVLLSR